MDKTLKQNGGTAPPFAIALTSINKQFGPVRANQDIDLNVRAGTIHGIIGENGAGKSTLVSILYGFYTADSGSIALHGEPIDIRSSADAIAKGIGMVHQHFMLVPNFTVLENVILGHEGKDGLSAGLEAGRRELTRLSDLYGLDVPLDAEVGTLPVGVQQRVEILKALYRGARILILDEPTGVLTPQETDQLFDILDTLREQNVTVLLITHKLREIMAITDYVSVMRAGQMVDHLATSDTNPKALAELMVGRPVLLEADYPDPQVAETLLDVRGLSYHNEAGAPLLKDVSFSVRRGEILGIAGVSGNGQSELLELLAGILTPTSGEIDIAGATVSAQTPLNPAEVKALGVAHVPEDRHAVGMVLPFSAAETAVLGYEHDKALGSSWFFSPAKLYAHCAKLMSAFDVRPANPNLKCSQFSGGNQQKIVLAREISSEPSILLVGQPTRGVDIGAIEFIHKELIALRDRGCAILLVSVELDEILSLSDRVMVMNNGQNMGIMPREKADPQSLGLLMAGVEMAGVGMAGADGKEADAS